MYHLNPNRLNDTSPEVEAIHIERLHDMPTWRKFQMVSHLNKMGRQLAIAGIRERYPDATERQVKRHLADLLLGEDLAEKAYGKWDEQSIDNPIDVIFFVTSILDDLSVAYTISGSVAGSLHGEMRMDANVDIVAQLRPEHVKSFKSRLDGQFDIVGNVKIEVIEQGQFFLSHLTTLFQVNIFVAGDDPFENERLARSQKRSLGSAGHNKQLRFASAEDTILAKLRWYRMGGETSERQWRDVEGVLKVQGNRLDFEYMRGMAKQIGVDDLLAVLLERE